MKKIILSIALATLPFGAYATGNYSRSGVEARVGGAVSSYSGSGNGYQRSAASMSSTAGAFAAAGASGFGHGIYGYRYTPVGVGAHSGAYAVGGAYSTSHGTVTGGATGYNYGYAAYDAEAASEQSKYGSNQHAVVDSNAWASGSAETEVFGNGASYQGTASGAFNTSVAHAERSPWWNAGRSEADGSTYGGSGSISGGLTYGAANGSAGSAAGQWGSADSRSTDGVSWKSSEAKGWADTGSYSNSGVIGTGAAGGYTLGGASYDAKARDGYFLDTARVSDTKWSTSDSFQIGNAGTTSFGDASLGAYARAGNRVRTGGGSAN